MPNRPQFQTLELELQRGSIAPEYVSRTICELQDHFDDLLDEALRAGLSESEASVQARVALGDDSRIAAAVLHCDQLKCWSVRHPFTSACCRTLATAAAAPTAPVLYCWNHGSSIARWSISTSLAMVMTASLLLALEMMLPFA